MNDWLLEKLEKSREETEAEIKELKEEVEHLSEEIQLYENLSEANDYGMNEEQLEDLKYDTSALKNIRSWYENRLEKPEHEKTMLDFKIRYRKEEYK